MGLFGRKRKEREEAEARAQAEQQRIREQNARASVPPVPVKPAESELSPAAAALAERFHMCYTSTRFDLSLQTVKDFYPLPERFVVFDLETTGLNASTDSIVEIGAVRVVSGELAETFQVLVDPGVPMPEAAMRVNGITDAMLRGKPQLRQVLPFFLDFVGDDLLAAHNALFDARFLLQACYDQELRAPLLYFDTTALAPYWDAPDKKLATLARCAGIRNDAAHRALGDAQATAQLILKTEQRMAEQKEAAKAAREREKLERAAAAEAFELRDDDRMLYATRCGLPSIKNARNHAKGYEMGFPSYNVAKELQKVGRLDDALIMLNKARALGYEAPALYECYVTIYRKQKDYPQELAMIDEFLSRETYGKREKFEERRVKVLALMEKAAGDPHD